MDPHARRARARGLRLLILDVDGVLTDGRLHYGPEGEALKVFHVRDGHGLKQLARAGVQLAIITGRDSPMVAQRAREIGIERVIQGCDDKGSAAAELAAALRLEPDTVGYVGDDEPDLPALEWAGLAFTVADAHECARAVADYVATRGGGDGAVREICDFVRAAIEGPASP